ncbi:hypothetical protein KP509_08G017100 [Ceratopteris richardii]|uniref:Homeobox domain-containing protein n=1 Tax=Ceratopteris richardii TaxID=49495 RepID=A0A8T2UEG1_CERRI|nr:hypothetical protein KP509_08G017100 [Ceratopteris richardii]KAH7430846.1 hypothetical protein KP509_08G017100 [Ceratopteris richardii]KAH7430848.1 hypothetical protein KP509_08G017100 [Ceratopteris richardii]KAH7430849.1 hypothetical protein KP509_08G017100 [Ceratopteris richardii]
MEPHHLQPNPPDNECFAFYDHRRQGAMNHDPQARESDLLNTIISFPSASSAVRSLILQRNSIQDTRQSPPSSAFVLQQDTNSMHATLDAATRCMKDKIPLQLSNALTSSIDGDKLRRTMCVLSSRESSGLIEGNILARFNPGPPICGSVEGSWQLSSANAISETTSVTNESIQLPMGSSLCANGALSVLPMGCDEGRATADYRENRDAGIWGAVDHGTELLLLPGVSGACNERAHYQKVVPQVERHNDAADQEERHGSAFGGLSGYSGHSATSGGGNLRDLSLSLSAWRSPHHVLLGAPSSLPGHTQSSIFLKAAQSILRELCHNAVTTAGGSFLTEMSSKDELGIRGIPVAGGGITRRSHELSITSGGFKGHGCRMTPIASSGTPFQQHTAHDMLGISQFERHHLLQHQHPQQHSQQQMLPSVVGNLDDRSQYGRGQSYSNTGHSSILSSTGLTERPQELELHRAKLYVMLEELDKQFKRYQEQMQMLMIDLDTTQLGMMVEGAAPFKAAANQAIHSKFACLREAILSNESVTQRSLADHNEGLQMITQGIATAPAGSGSLRDQTDGAAARFRFLDQQLRHQRVLQQAGLFPQPPWRPQRGLPERSVSLLRAWLFDHFLHPYPKDTEKVLLARQTGLTRNQVSNWFINARVRLWKPMVEEMYQEEVKMAEVRRGSGQRNSNKLPNSTYGSSGANEADQAKKQIETVLENRIDIVQDISSIHSVQGLDTSRFLYKHGDHVSEPQPRQFQAHQGDQVSFAGAINNMDAAPTWSFMQHQNGAFEPHEQQQHPYCNNDLGPAMMRFGSAGGVTLTLGLQQHSGAANTMNSGGPHPLERTQRGVEDVNPAAQRW